LQLDMYMGEQELVEKRGLSNRIERNFDQDP
jgi:hypothetical protein